MGGHQEESLLCNGSHSNFGKDPPTANSIREYYEMLVYMHCIRKRKTCRPASRGAETIHRVLLVALRNPRKPICRPSRDLNVPQTSAWKIVRKHLALWPYLPKIL